MPDVSDFMSDFRSSLLYMFEVPWRHSGLDKTRAEHWVTWLAAWGWAVIGLVAGAMVSPMIVQLMGFSDSPYQDVLVIAVALLSAFAVQLIGWVLSFILFQIYDFDWVPLNADLPFVILAILLPLAGVGYGLYRYLTWVGASQRTVTIAFVGALLIKTFAIPLIKGIVTGTLFKLFMKWLRGGKDTKKAG